MQNRSERTELAAAPHVYVKYADKTILLMPSINGHTLISELTRNVTCCTWNKYTNILNMSTYTCRKYNYFWCLFRMTQLTASSLWTDPIAAAICLKLDRGWWTTVYVTLPWWQCSNNNLATFNRRKGRETSDSMVTEQKRKFRNMRDLTNFKRDDSSVRC